MGSALSRAPGLSDSSVVVVVRLCLLWWAVGKMEIGTLTFVICRRIVCIGQVVQNFVILRMVWVVVVEL